MGGSRNDALDGREFFGNEFRYVAQIIAFHHHEQIVTAGHQITGAHFGIFGDALSQAVETAAAFGRDLYFDQGADDVGPIFSSFKMAR